MSEAGWSYIVPYQPDVGKAFQELRQKVFEAGNYLKPWEYNEASEEVDKQEQPKTIEELLEQCGPYWTYSILDMERVETEPSTVPELGVIYPLAKKDLITLFETDRPTVEDIYNFDLQNFEDTLTMEWVDILSFIPGKWQGIYFTVYKDNEPCQYHFYGISGD